jgi:hypothetical protein
MPFGLGFFATAGAGAAGSFDLLETQILGSAQASVTFSNLNSTYGATYQHLQIRATMRDAGANASFGFRFNADSGNNYARHNITGNGSSVSSGAGTSENGGFLASGANSNTTANAFNGAVIDILDAFETTKYKTVRTLSGTTGSPTEVMLVSSLWQSTAAATSFQIYSRFGTNLAANCRFSLYGIKAA